MRWQSALATGSWGIRAIRPSDIAVLPKAATNLRIRTPFGLLVVINRKSARGFFLGVVPFVFWGLGFIYFKCKIRQEHGGWAQQTLTNISDWGLGKFMTDMGYNITNLISIKGSDVANILDSGGIHTFSELSEAYKTASYSSYESFLGKHEANVSKNSISTPLATCLEVTKLFCKSLTQQGKQDEEPLSKIKSILKGFETSLGHHYHELKYQIGDFIRDHLTTHASTAAHPNDSASPAGPVAGTLTTLGLGGGAAAAYIFNLGGARTLINGLLRIG
ncbi:variant erythrocyte surface antigen-1 family protein [Babesia caballi]|uniref:Variant erythrocyte surface antigen-1 family protein n=1 Tax=Babesia caballi TaxID=5871 RepID=A0AAV4LRB1_BABCB|nr:variant erythrocyte surface antigen-1 family protein [Babesia caballi]